MPLAGPASFRSALFPSLLLALALVLPPLAGPGSAHAGLAADGSYELDVDYVPTPMPSVRRMLELAQAGPDDHVVDLGSGDGRILITAVLERGVRSAIGVELDPWLVGFANERAASLGVADRIRFVRGDIFETEFANADVVTMYLLPKLNLRLRPYLLERLTPGTRIVSHSFDMGEWAPDAQDVLFGRGVYLWVVPARVHGEWLIERHNDEPPIRVSFEQAFQNVIGRATREGIELAMSEVELEGERIRFSIDGLDYAGTVEGDTIRPLQGLPWIATRQ